MKQPHKHAALIKAWADGAEIQVRYGLSARVTDATWCDAVTPNWYDDFEYRIKPEPKPDVVRYALVTSDRLNLCILSCGCDQDNIKLTFDGETLKLKAVEMIGEK